MRFDEAFLKKLEYLYVVSRKVFSGRMRAERRTRKTGSGVEFADHRDYTHGDDLRYLDWSAYGRLDKLLLRLFEEEEDLHIYLLVDVSASMKPKLDYALKVAAALAYVGLAKLDRVSIVPFGGELRELVRQVPVARPVQDYAIRVLESTHPSPSAPELTRKFIRYGASPRGAQACLLGAKIKALLDGRFAASADDIKAVAKPCLRHRLILNFEGEAEGIDPDTVIEQILQVTPE